MSFGNIEVNSAMFSFSNRGRTRAWARARTRARARARARDLTRAGGRRTRAGTRAKAS